MLLLGLVFLLSFISGEIATAGNAVVLAETRLVLIDWLVQEHLGVLGKHVLQDDLIKHALVLLGTARLLVLLVVRGVASATLRFAHN